MDLLHFVLAVGPVAVYLLLLGAINLSSRPLVTTGARDMAALGLALTGCAIAGPLELFFPESFVTTPSLTWVMLICLYGLLVLLIVLLSRPRLVIYNLTTGQLRPTLSKVVTKLDPEARWAGDSAFLPNLGVQFMVEPFIPSKNVQLVSSQPSANVEGWRALEKELVQALRPERTSPNPFGYLLTTLGTLLTALVVISLVSNPVQITRSLETMFFIEPAPASDVPAATPEEPKS